MRRPIPCVLLMTLLAGPAAADTVVLKNGKRIEDVVVSRNDGEFVVVNPWNSRLTAMTWEIPEQNRIPASEVAEVVIEDPPLVEYRRRAAQAAGTADSHAELAAFCEKHGFDVEREWHLCRTLALDPGREDALKAVGRAKWDRLVKSDPDLNPQLRQLEQEYLGLTVDAELQAQWDRMREHGTTRSVTYLERARRSRRQGAGRRDKVPVTLRSDAVPGATYCVFVPTAYDPLRPAPLLLGLHGGGAGGKDSTLVTGSGEAAMNFYEGLAERWGWLVVCPSARVAGWQSKENQDWIPVVLEEMRALYNVDLTRVYLAGHSMGGFGAWYWGTAHPELFAAFSPCAGGGGSGSVEIPVYIYHGADDNVVSVSSDRSAAKALLGGGRKKKRKKGEVQVVYTELDGVGHGFPGEVREQIFLFFAGHMKDDGRKRATAPVSSFDAKPGKAEIEAFGDPSVVVAADAEESGDLKDLLDGIRRGGGAGLEAAERFAARELHTPAAVKALRKILRSDKSTVDSRVLAARAIGHVGLPEGIKPLSDALGDGDYRVLEAATWALGRIGRADAIPPLARAAERMTQWYRDSFTGPSIGFNEYQVRLGSFQVLVDALAAARDGDSAVPLLEEHVVAGILAPAEKPVVRLDERFVSIPPEARRALTARLVECLVDLGRKDGVALLERVAAAWPDEPALAGVVADGIRRLQP